MTRQTQHSGRCESSSRSPISHHACKTFNKTLMVAGIQFQFVYSQQERQEVKPKRGRDLIMVAGIAGAIAGWRHGANTRAVEKIPHLRHARHCAGTRAIEIVGKTQSKTRQRGVRLEYEAASRPQKAAPRASIHKYLKYTNI